MIGWAFRVLAIWGAAALLIYVVVARRLPNEFNAAQPPAAEAVAPAPRAATPNSLVFRANRDGHVFLEAAVNGSPVRFLVDTGATYVALTMRDAAAAGLGSNNLVFSGRTSTANGVARVAPVRLRELRIGQFSADDVPAVVGENLGFSLLGQSFLRRLDSYEMRDGALTLNWN